MRRGFIHNESPLATPKSSKCGVPDATNEPMDEWELKLLGKKGGKCQLITLYFVFLDSTKQ